MKVVQGKPGRHVLDLIVEDGHKNAGAARVVFEDTRKYLKFKQIDLLGTVTLAKKKDCELLMMADFQAHASGVSALQRAQPELIVHGTSTPTHRPDEAAVTSISLRAETFAEHQAPIQHGCEKVGWPHLGQSDSWKNERGAILEKRPLFLRLSDAAKSHPT